VESGEDDGIHACSLITPLWPVVLTSEESGPHELKIDIYTSKERLLLNMENQLVPGVAAA